MDRSRYRYVNFIGGHVLQARDMNALQLIASGIDADDPTKALRSVYDLDAIYQEGAVLNCVATITPNTKTVTLTPINVNLPMLVFVRGRWEILKLSEAAAVTLLTEDLTKIYLNWSLEVRTMADDVELKDVTTQEATVEMGELVLSVSATDNSGTDADTDVEFEKNLAPIVLFSFTHTTDSLTQDPKDNVHSYALASGDCAGLVRMSGSSSIAVSTDDPKMVNERVPVDGSVTDAKVRVPLQDGSATNADGTKRYDLTKDAGGINSTKIVHQPGVATGVPGALLSEVVEKVTSDLEATTAELVAHEDRALGVAASHPMPTAAQVGATPASHQTMSLDQAHGLTAAKDAGGFVVVRDKAVLPTPGDGAFVVKDEDGDLVRLMHDGDVFSKAAQSYVAPNVGGLNGGLLGLMSNIARLLGGHMGQHGTGSTTASNPHGLTLNDLGYTPGDPAPEHTDGGWSDTTVIVQPGDFGDVLAQAKAYTDSKCTVTFRTESTGGVGWLIVTLMDKAEIAFGHGMLSHGDNLGLPGGFPGNQAWATAGMSQVNFVPADGVFDEWDFSIGQGGGEVTATEYNWSKGMHLGNVSVSAVAWRVL